MSTAKNKSAARTKIERFAKILGVTIESLEWTPLGRGGEMQGPSGGWECQLKDGGDCYGLNADDLCESIAITARADDRQRTGDVYYKLGVASAAKEKDATIAELRRRLASGDADAGHRTINEYKAEGIVDLLHAVYRSSSGEPPMRDMWVLRVLAERHLGKWWDRAELFVAKDEPVKFEPLAVGERKKYWDASPWNDLARIRKAAGTEDTDAIVAMLPNDAPTGKAVA